MFKFILRLFPEKVTVWAIIIFSTLSALLRWLSRSWGLFFLSASAYVWLHRFGETKPLSPGELGEWFLSLDTSTQGIVAGVVSAVLGAVIAFRTAHANWIAQRRIELSLSIASDLEAFFHELSNRFTSVQLYGKLLLELSQMVTAQGETNAAFWKTRFVLGQTPQHLENRKRLSEMSIEINRYVYRYTAFLSETSEAMDLLSECAESTAELSAAMWFPVPIPADVDQLLIRSALEPLNLKMIRKFVRLEKAHAPQMAFKVGAIRGKLMKDIKMPSFATSYWVFRNRKAMIAAFRIARGKGRPP